MSYRNRTYVIFDGDNDMWAYAYMKGWKTNEHIDFNFYDAHDVHRISDRASEATVKHALRQRMANAKQAIVLVGDSTKNLYRFVRWEIDLTIQLDLPIVVVNLNNLRTIDASRCPAILRIHCAIHVAFKMKMIKFALDGFPDWYAREGHLHPGPRYYENSVYQKLGI